MKITVITAAWNAAGTLADTMRSVRSQRLGDGTELEYLLIDGGSTDGTAELARAFAADVLRERPKGFTFRWVSERDKGLYDAINKGIRAATGEVVGICNADDILASDDVIARMAGAFDAGVDLVYGDVRFAKAVSGVDALRGAPVTRYCTGRFFRKWMFRFATFPAHPSTFARRACFEKAGGYSLDYRICADFEMMLRLFWKEGVRAKYLPLCTHVMRAGGLSTGGLHSNVEINREDLRALRANGYRAILPFMYLKYPFKVFGILFRKRYMRQCRS